MKSKITLCDSVIESAELPPETLALAVDQYNRDGALLIENLFDRSDIQRLSEIYARKYASLSPSELGSRFACVGDQRYMITLEMKGKFNSPDLYANGLLMPILHQLLGSQCVISSFGSVIAFPGADAQPVHFDYPPLFEDEATCAGLPAHAITLVVPLIDIDDTTGSTAIWPGTHRRVGARNHLRDLAESGSVEGSVCPQPKMSDAFLMDFRLIHAGTPNTGHLPRPILYIVYSRPWFREDMNFAEQPAINLSRKQYKKVPKRLRYLFASATQT